MSAATTTMMFSVLEEKYTAYVKDAQRSGTKPMNPVEWLNARLDSRGCQQCAARNTERSTPQPERVMGTFTGPEQTQSAPRDNAPTLSAFATIMRDNNLMSAADLLRENIAARAELRRMKREEEEETND